MQVQYLVKDEKYKFNPQSQSIAVILLRVDAVDMTWGGYQQTAEDELWEGTSAPHVHPHTHIWLTFRPAQLPVTYQQRQVDGDSIWHVWTKTSSPAKWFLLYVLFEFRRDTRSCSIFFPMQSEMILYGGFRNPPQGAKSTQAPRDQTDTTTA